MQSKHREDAAEKKIDIEKYRILKVVADQAKGYEGEQHTGPDLDRPLAGHIRFYFFSPIGGALIGKKWKATLGHKTEIKTVLIASVSS
ncbi:hypothetical protein [Acidovorax sp. BoFeN1]|uniref:hypothetical protein n=1 Tax=Acidovorax sp. BoFeN1 TaxID=1231053 RepID=UPI0011C05179|nr:hypothetical protein [Acidovorax sp. BoFeN1]